MVALVVTGVALYVVLPSLTAVIGAWPRLAKLSGVWLVAALLAEAASFLCTFGIQRIVLRTRGWFAVVAAGLIGNLAPMSCPAEMPREQPCSSACWRGRGSTPTPPGRPDSVVSARGRRPAHAPDPHPSGRSGWSAREPCPCEHSAHRGAGSSSISGLGSCSSNRSTAAVRGEGRPMDLEQGSPSPRTVDRTRRSSADPARPDTWRIGEGVEAGPSSRGGTHGVRLSLPARNVTGDRK